MRGGTQCPTAAQKVGTAEVKPGQELVVVHLLQQCHCKVAGSGSFSSVFSSLRLATQIPSPVWGSQELQGGAGEYWWEIGVTENPAL